MSSLAVNVIKLLFIIITKGFPLVREVLLRDRNTLEFLSENKTTVIMLGLVLLLSVLLINAKYKLGKLQPSVTPCVPIPVMPVNPPLPDGPLPTPLDPAKTGIVPNRHEGTREFIRKRLGEIE